MYRPMAGDDKHTTLKCGETGIYKAITTGNAASGSNIA